jgi:hypothetical protein
VDGVECEGVPEGGMVVVATAYFLHNVKAILSENQNRRPLLLLTSVSEIKSLQVKAHPMEASLGTSGSDDP